MSDAARTILFNWIFFLISNGVLGASVMMLAKGTLPPPMTRVKVPAILSTALFVIGLTGMLRFGTPDLLQGTIGLFVK